MESIWEWYVHLDTPSIDVKNPYQGSSYSYPLSHESNTGIDSSSLVGLFCYTVVLFL